MGLSLIPPPTLEPVSLAEAKAHLRVDNADDDGLIVGQILAARNWAEAYMRSGIVTQTWDYTTDYGWPVCSVRGVTRYRIELPLHPVQSVTHVKYVDDDGVTQTLSGVLYTLHKFGVGSYIEKAYNADFPSIRSVPDAITVRFVVGYTTETIPDDIKVGILLKLESLYDRCEEKSCVLSTAQSMLDPHRLLRVA